MNGWVLCLMKKMRFYLYINGCCNLYAQKTGFVGPRKTKISADANGGVGKTCYVARVGFIMSAQSDINAA